ncbi:MAG: nucleotidyltransferase domain-containing protein [Phormidesmis sp.]
MNHGLTAQDLAHIRAAAAELTEIAQVILFGSRAKGTYQQGSDVDLAISAISGKGITHSTVLRLSESLNEERPLPYFFDVVNYDSLEDEPLQQHIDRVGILLFSASEDESKYEAYEALSR